MPVHDRVTAFRHNVRIPYARRHGSRIGALIAVAILIAAMGAVIAFAVYSIGLR